MTSAGPDMLALLSQAFILGLSVGPACLGFCAPVCIPFLASEERQHWRATARLLVLYLLGRLAGYTLIGAAVGLLGSALLGSASPAFWGGVRISTGLLLLVFGFWTRPSAISWCPRPGWRTGSPWFAAGLGLLSGLSLCPPFGAAIAGAAATASVRNSILYFWVFFAGTAIYFAPLVLLSPISRREAFRQVARICLFLVAAWLILEGTIGWMK